MPILARRDLRGRLSSRVGVSVTVGSGEMWGTHLSLKKGICYREEPTLHGEVEHTRGGSDLENGLFPGHQFHT